MSATVLSIVHRVSLYSNALKKRYGNPCYSFLSSLHRILLCYGWLSTSTSLTALPIIQFIAPLFTLFLSNYSANFHLFFWCRLVNRDPRVNIATLDRYFKPVTPTNTTTSHSRPVSGAAASGSSPKSCHTSYTSYTVKTRVSW